MRPVVEVGDIVDGRYQIDRVIGRGGMGVVMAATHVQLREPVAIKFLLPDADANEGARDRFLREARACARLKSEHVVRVIDFGVFETGSPVLVMEHLEGEDLASVLEREGSLPVDTVVDYLLQACEAVAEAHARGIVHRDLKPSNLFLTVQADGSPFIKILDFGVAKTLHEVEDNTSSLGRTSRNTLLGSAGYMSPEQVRSSPEIDARADIWALGVVLYELLTGHIPFEADSLAVTLANILRSPAPTFEGKVDVPKQLGRLLQWSLEKDPDQRCPSVKDFARLLYHAAPSDARRLQRERIDRLASALDVSGVNPAVRSDRTSDNPEASVVTAWRRTQVGRRSSKKRPLLLGGIGAFVLAGLVFGIYAGRSSSTVELRGLAAPVASMDPAIESTYPVEPLAASILALEPAPPPEPGASSAFVAPSATAAPPPFVRPRRAQRRTHPAHVRPERTSTTTHSSPAATQEPEEPDPLEDRR